MGIGGIGLPELIIVFIIALLVLGPKRLPEVGRSVGNGIREFKDSLTGDKKEHEQLVEYDEDDDGVTKTAHKAGLSG